MEMLSRVFLWMEDSNQKIKINFGGKNKIGLRKVKYHQRLWIILVDSQLLLQKVIKKHLNRIFCHFSQLKNKWNFLWRTLIQSTNRELLRNGSRGSKNWEIMGRYVFCRVLHSHHSCSLCVFWGNSIVVLGKWCKWRLRLGREWLG